MTVVFRKNKGERMLVSRICASSLRWLVGLAGDGELARLGCVGASPLAWFYTGYILLRGLAVRSGCSTHRLGCDAMFSSS